MTLGGPEGELGICENLITEFPNGFVACVSDSYDIFHCINEYWGGVLKDKVLNRNGTLVIRPDSGDPVIIVPMVLEALGNKFGYRVNKKGYKVLNDKVRIIQGDGINVKSHKAILIAVMEAGWSVENLAFGSGGALLQKVNRDMFSFSFKCSYAIVDGKPRDVYKKPKTDPTKNSKRGLLALVRDKEGRLITVPEAEASQYESGNLLVEVFRDGELLVDLPFEMIREAAELLELETVS
jgi:nicotinamide phosphoribosyltransferase